jgi:hypothetical protein
LRSSGVADTLSPTSNLRIETKNPIIRLFVGIAEMELGMPKEPTLSQFLAERHWPDAVLALVADIDESAASRIIRGQSRPRGTTAVRMAEGLGIGYARMRRILAATWEAGQAAPTGPPRRAADQGSTPGRAAR